MDKDKAKNKTYTMRISAELYEKLEKEAERRKRSVTS
jgi:predicted DNA-binding protein